MKIALVAHDLVRGDGQGRINYEIVKYALSLGHQVTVLADRIESDLIELGAISIPIHPRISRPGIFDVRLFTRQADRILNRLVNEVDCIVGNGYTLTVPHQLNLCQFVHASWIRSRVHTVRTRPGPYGWYQYVYSAFNARWEKISYRRAGAIVVPSRLAKNELLGIGVPAEKIHLIPNGVDLTEFSPGKVDRRELGLPTDVPLGLFAGDIQTSRKNLDTVLKAMQQTPDLHLAVVGKLPRSPYPAMAERLGVAERVHFLGFRRDVAQILRAVDLFIFPSRYDTFALVVLEALAAGVPVITASTVGASELMTPACGTVLADPDDVQQLTQAIHRHLEPSVDRPKTSIAARELAEKHSWTEMARTYLNLIHPAP